MVVRVCDRECAQAKIDRAECGERNLGGAKGLERRLPGWNDQLSSSVVLNNNLLMSKTQSLADSL